MSGPYKFEREQAFGDWVVARPDGFRFAVAGSKTSAESLVCELNRLHTLAESRSGSPEGWPEGAELVPTRDLYRNPDDYEVWSTVASWCGVSSRNWGEVPGGVLVVARRKPKPVTRDVRVEDVRGVVRFAAHPGPVAIRPAGLLFRDDGETVDTVSFVRADGENEGDLFATYPGNFTVAVLVEEPNG